MRCVNLGPCASERLKARPRSEVIEALGVACSASVSPTRMPLRLPTLARVLGYFAHGLAGLSRSIRVTSSVGCQSPNGGSDWEAARARDPSLQGLPALTASSSPTRQLMACRLVGPPRTV